MLILLVILIQLWLLLMPRAQGRAPHSNPPVDQIRPRERAGKIPIKNADDRDDDECTKNPKKLNKKEQGKKPQ